MSRSSQKRSSSSDLQDVVDTAEELLGTIGDGGGQVVDELKARAREKLSSARAHLREAGTVAREAAGTAAGETDAYVRGNPWAAVAVAGTVGLLIGAALSRRS